ncbi:MAG TPA: phosphonate metabolism transcriptional regulator PhnF [Devosiaceae bacterium]|nr:phosphonate metabolism transcriptional regulator PhnF [Devosiaceae bacterium]
MASIGESHISGGAGHERGRLWRGVAAALREDIRSGKLMVGMQLMTELDMASHFGVSRFTVRRALAELEKEGLVRIEHGRGLFVAEDAIPYALGERTRWSENMNSAGLDSQRRILSSTIEEADAQTQRALELPPGAEVVVVDSMGDVSGRPLSMGRGCFPADRFQGIDDLLRKNPSRTAAYRAFGITDYKRKSTRIIARLPNVREAKTLKLPKTRPVFEIHKIDVDLNGRPISFGISCVSSDRVQLIIE